MISYHIEGTEEVLGPEKRKIFDDAMEEARSTVGWNTSTDSLYDKATQVRKPHLITKHLL